MSKIAHLPAPAAKTAPRSPARAALAAAIERHADVRREVEENKQARTGIYEMMAEADRAELAAKEAIDEARNNSAAYYTARALGTTGDRPQSVKEAHAAHAAAVDESESLAIAGSTLASKGRELEEAEKWTGIRVTDAIRAVIADEATGIAQRLAVEYETMARDLAERHAALDWLSYRGAFGVDDRWHPPTHFPDVTGKKVWQATEAALTTDPDAALPAG